tara:strand:- start:1855 stop:2037 length:183 start_codon:yes stop_codon:yes gene_type:complete
MKKLALSLVLIGTMSSCGLSLGNYDAYKKKNNKICPTSSIEMTQDEFYESLECCNCDEVD